ncbi:MAG: hypothetical protein J2P31_01615 [Blastocatellia bacterium]|nr:hypothetical protein [Blastocatellia bacterium]
MSKIYYSLFLIFIILLTPAAHRRNSDPVVFTTQPRLAFARLIPSNPAFSSKKITLEGRASLTVRKANDDDTITGVFVFTVTEDARAKLAEISNADLEEIPAKYSKENVTARFQKGTTCPSIHMEITSPVDLDAFGSTMKLEHVMLDIPESPAKMAQYFCAWTRQINARRQRIGLIAAINELINPEN